MRDESLVSKMEGKTNFLRRMKQFDGLTCLTLTRPHFTTDLRHCNEQHSRRRFCTTYHKYRLDDDDNFWQQE